MTHFIEDISANEIIDHIHLPITADDIRTAYQQAQLTDPSGQSQHLSDDVISRSLQGLLRGHLSHQLQVLDWQLVADVTSRVATA